MPKDEGLRAFNRWCWLHNAVGREPEAVLPDGSPGPRELWAMFGTDAIELWHRHNGDDPHPRVDALGLPDAGARRR